MSDQNPNLEIKTEKRKPRSEPLRDQKEVEYLISNTLKSIVLKLEGEQPKGNIDSFVEANRPVLNRNENVKDAKEKVVDLTAVDILNLVQWYKKDGSKGTELSKKYANSLGDKLKGYRAAKEKIGTASESEIMREIASKYRGWVRYQVGQQMKLRSSKALGFFFSDMELCMMIEMDYQIYHATSGVLKTSYRPINLTSFMCELDPKNRRKNLSPVCNFLSDYVQVSELRQHKFIANAQIAWNEMWKKRLGSEDEMIVRDNGNKKSLKTEVDKQKLQVQEVVSRLVEHIGAKKSKDKK
jgi:hypothetical protein